MHIDVMARRGGAMHFERVSAVRRAEIHRAVREQHLANERRSQIEHGNAGRGGGPVKSTLPRSSLQANAQAAAQRNAGGKAQTNGFNNMPRNAQRGQCAVPPATAESRAGPNDQAEGWWVVRASVKTPSTFKSPVRNYAWQGFFLHSCGSGGSEIRVAPATHEGRVVATRRLAVEPLAQIRRPGHVAFGRLRCSCRNFCKWAGCVWMNSSLTVGIWQIVDQAQVDAHPHAREQVHGLFGADRLGVLQRAIGPRTLVVQRLAILLNQRIPHIAFVRDDARDDVSRFR